MNTPRDPAPENPTPARETEATLTPGSPDPGTGLRVGHVCGDRYEIRARLGSGGMGEVWLASDLKLRVEVALKSVRTDYLADATFRELLRREVRAAREVLSPNVCRVFDLVEAGGLELVSMEYVDGTTLADVLKERAPLPLGEARDLAAQFLAGLEAVHEASLVHRDFKPENVMITRTGRVVVMDLGIAEHTEAASGRVAGTPAYMAPEQARGAALDARADVFAAGVVLAEMVAPQGIRDREKRITLWESVRASPPRLPESPWAAVIAKAVSAEPEGRYGSARELSRALDGVTLRIEEEKGVEPYPGLQAFTEKEAARFFGREAEVEQLLRKLGRARLLAIAGPSGAGKTSFVQAGLVPALPEEWGHITFHPGDRPFAALAHALVPELSDDAEALGELVDLEAPARALSALGRWRRRHGQALVIVDQFEELFTLSSPEVQERFAELLGRLPLEADVHVLLSMRDDFLLRCHTLEGLGPVFAELTPLEAPTGAALRRALVQPALSCGYRFEDEALVDAMLGEVERERGALPLLAFAAASLWAKRDRDEGLLRRRAYDEVGGVGGALAQHAEATLDRIGKERTPIVREIFRNLVTAEGTRAVRDREELLSVFKDSESYHEAAGQVLDVLINARLLTSYERPGEEGQESRHQVEVIHESLLTAWPRLVRWQTQDAEGAQLRDQLRQAAHAWESRDRPNDLLWTGTSYREFELWRERYPGRLSTIEETFARAAVRLAGRRRARRRVALATLVATMGAVALVTSLLWRRSEAARERAEVETRRAEASTLVALGQLEVEGYPTAALAYARRSLELADTPAGRLLALEALWRGPTARILPLEGTTSLSAEFSPDGRWLASFTASENVLLFPEDGGPPRAFGGHRPPIKGWVELFFTPDGNALLTRSGQDPFFRFRMLSVPDGRELRWLGPDLPRSGPGSLWGFWCGNIREGVIYGLRTGPAEDSIVRLELWPFDGGPPRALGSVVPEAKLDYWNWLLTGSHLAIVRDGRILVRPLAGPPSTAEREIAVIGDGRLHGLRFSPGGEWLAVAEGEGRLALWSLGPAVPRRPRVLELENADGWPVFDAEGSRLAWGASEGTTLWRLDGPPDTDPVELRRGSVQQTGERSFHPGGDWLAVANNDSLTFWAMNQPQPFVLRKHDSPMWNVLFTPDSKWLVACVLAHEVRMWPLDGPAQATRTVGVEGVGRCSGLAVAPDGSRLVLGGPGGARVLSLLRDEARILTERPPDGGIWGVAFDPTGRRVAAATSVSSGLPKMLRVWDLDSHAAPRELPLVPPGETGDGYDFGGGQLQFTPEGDLLVAGGRGIRHFDLQTGGSEWLWRLERGWFASMALSRDGQRLLAAATPQEAEGSGDHPVVLLDLAAGTRRPITSHGNRVGEVALDPSGEILVTGDEHGVVRVGPADGGQPHLLLGHSDAVRWIGQGLAVSPDGHWIASASGTEIRVWPMPDVTKTPLHSLPLDELLAKLSALTNVQVVENDASLTGYTIEIGPFPGWEEAPDW